MDHLLFANIIVFTYVVILFKGVERLGLMTCSGSHFQAFLSYLQALILLAVSAVLVLTALHFALPDVYVKTMFYKLFLLIPIALIYWSYSSLKFRIKSAREII